MASGDRAPPETLIIGVRGPEVSRHIYLNEAMAMGATGVIDTLP